MNQKQVTIVGVERRERRLHRLVGLNTVGAGRKLAGDENVGARQAKLRQKIGERASDKRLISINLRAASTPRHRLQPPGSPTCAVSMKR